jgi:hypothetical protein
MQSTGFGACELETNVETHLAEHVKRIREVKDALARNEKDVTTAN